MCKAVEHSKNNFNKLAVVAHVLHATQNLVILRRRYAENGKEMYQYSLRMSRAIVLLIKPFAIAVVVCLNSAPLAQLYERNLDLFPTIFNSPQNYSEPPFSNTFLTVSVTPSRQSLHV